MSRAEYMRQLRTVATGLAAAESSYDAFDLTGDASYLLSLVSPSDAEDLALDKWGMSEVGWRGLAESYASDIESVCNRLENA